MFGVAHYLLQQPSTALRYHLQCLYAIENGTVKDLSLKLSILHNIANDYWALHDIPNAIDAYKRALSLAEDLDGLDRQAGTLWALGMAYRAANDWPQAKLYASRALNIYEALHDMSRAASLCIHLAELFIGDARYDDAQEHLAKAETILEKTNDQLLLSTVHADYADLHRKKGDLETAERHATESISLINALTGSAAPYEERAGTVPDHPPIDVTRAHVEALQVAALVAEERGRREDADKLFEKAQQLVAETELVELAHTLAFSYAEVLSSRGDYPGAARLYRIAAQARPRRHQDNQSLAR
jgi:tetratricopeptide (TPR) repeat protein